ncbi:MAG: hypothetical protein K2M73_04840 [Lachnospiraceae bacterium]|nr:hypothetical protein [Lachnospiraceae bacterium]
MKRKKTLPADFEEILKRGDIEEIRNVLEKCEVDAHKPYEKKTVLFFTELPEEIIRYLVLERGTDINQLSQHNNTALAEHAFSHLEHIPLFIELGADVNYYEGFGSTPIHQVAGFHRVEGVRELLKYGADPSIRCGWYKDNAMEHTLKTCRNIDICNTAEIAEMLIEKGVTVTEEMKKEVVRIGTDFEFYRSEMAPECVEEIEPELQKLYDLFSVSPVPKKQVYDGKTPITVKSDTWQKQHEELWNMLVPGKGQANTVQGEVIRIIGKISCEILDNGAINWDKEYRKLTTALTGYLQMGKPVEKDVLLIAKGICADSDEDELYRLCEACVKWVLANPNPIGLDSVDYKR